MKATDKKKKAEQVHKETSRPQQELHTEGPISERDEVKKAEERLRSPAKNK
jgi:hypothetical protein